MTSDLLRTAVQASFLAGVEPDIVADLLEGRRIREVAAGSVFVDESRPARCGLVLSGLARVYAVRVDGSQVTLRRVGVGAAVGVRALLGRGNQLRVQAISAVEFLELDAAQLIGSGFRHPTLAMAIAAEIDRRLEDTEIELSGRQGSVLQRVAAVLLDLSAEGQPLGVTISHERLAEMIGASRVRVSHEVRALAEAGLIRQDRGQITLLDALRLQAVARDVGWHAAGDGRNARRRPTASTD